MPDLTLSSISCSTAFLLLVAITTLPSIAQDNVAADDIVEGSAELLVEVAAPSALNQCNADKTHLVDTLVQLQQEGLRLLAACKTTSAASILSLEEQLKVCTENERLNRRTNIGLNDALLACRSGPPPDDIASSEALQLAEAQIEALRLRLAALDGVQIKLNTAEATVAQLEARLEEIDVNLVPEFSYFGADPFVGFVRASDIASLVGPDGILEANQCKGAMDWLISQSGEGRPLRLVLWVVQDGEFALCKQGLDGLVDPTPSDEAHLVLFR